MQIYTSHFKWQHFHNQMSTASNIYIYMALSAKNNTTGNELKGLLNETGVIHESAWILYADLYSI